MLPATGVAVHTPWPRRWEVDSFGLVLRCIEEDGIPEASEHEK